MMTTEDNTHRNPESLENEMWHPIAPNEKPSIEMQIWKAPQETFWGRFKLNLADKAAWGFIAILLSIFVFLVINVFTYVNRDTIFLNGEPESRVEKIKHEYLLLADSASNLNFKFGEGRDFFSANEFSSLSWWGISLEKVVKTFSIFQVNLIKIEIAQKDSIKCKCDLFFDLRYVKKHSLLYASNEAQLIKQSALEIFDRLMPLNSTIPLIKATKYDEAIRIIDTVSSFGYCQLLSDSQFNFYCLRLKAQCLFEKWQELNPGCELNDTRITLDIAMEKLYNLSINNPQWMIQYDILRAGIAFEEERPEYACAILEQTLLNNLSAIKDFGTRLVQKSRVINNMINYRYPTASTQNELNRVKRTITEQIVEIEKFMNTKTDRQILNALKQIQGLLYLTRAEVETKIESSNVEAIKYDLIKGRGLYSEFRFSTALLNEFPVYRVIIKLIEQDTNWKNSMNLSAEELAWFDKLFNNEQVKWLNQADKSTKEENTSGGGGLGLDRAIPAAN